MFRKSRRHTNTWRLKKMQPKHIYLNTRNVCVLNWLNIIVAAKATLAQL